MTGFGKSSCSWSGRKYLVEIKTLNSKQADIYMRLPQVYKEKEIEIRTLIISRLERGKMDVFFSVEEVSAGQQVRINKDLVNSYYTEIKSMYAEIGAAIPDDTLLHILKFPEVLSSNDNLVEEEWEVFKKMIEDACIAVNEFRTTEGCILYKDLLQRTQLICSMIDDIIPFEKERINQIKNKLHNELKDLSGKINADENRFEQELIFYLERIDFTEEKTRLKSHCDYFVKTMKEDTANGKKLGFIAQEMGREINTIGSKANHSSIQQVVVQMKDELEKIKEQLLNIL